MGAPEDEFADQIKVQGWTMYAVGLMFVGLRMYASITKLGWRHLRLDDILMLPALVLYTGLIVGLNITCSGGGSIPYPPDAAGPLTEEDIQERIRGSKIALVNEQCLLNLLYVLKCCMLVLYTRLTLGTNAQRLVRLLAVYVALCWTTTQVMFFSHCRPFSDLYAFPPPSRDCTTYESYELVEGVLNVTSDLFMLCIPLPLVVRVRMPRRQKAMLVAVFSTGVFVIVAAVLTKCFDLTAGWDPAYMLWYIRETSVAVYVANMPIIWPLLLQWCPCLRPKSKLTRESDDPVLPAPTFAMPVFGAGAGSRGTGGTGGAGDAAESFHGDVEGRDLAERRPSEDGSEIDIHTALGAAPELLTPPQRSYAVPRRSLGDFPTPALASDSSGNVRDGNRTGTMGSRTDVGLPETSEQRTGTDNDEEKEKASGRAT
ncbi:uncharacterized protein PpBr36_06196 [Pyricularia pennisetigena]|uniref:uncharacterized protein n=1 Tax=Pyricularia pennisetigena TaxID=1578925 RepID=UPI00114D7CC5|nr:uncharacterized protein PpBr36_06196 [Pyricularia pennisetigena]TLS23364.1 hypothetical protein PpBr36_06196 [Pyricularia pennisetigena]